MSVSYTSMYYSETPKKTLKAVDISDVVAFQFDVELNHPLLNKRQSLKIPKRYFMRVVDSLS